MGIYETRCLGFRDSEDGANLLGVQEGGNIYCGIMNGRNEVFEKGIGEVEGGIGGVGVCCGEGGRSYCILKIGGGGEEIV